MSLYFADHHRPVREGVLDQGFLRDYIQYGRVQTAPEVSREAEEMLVQGYLQMRAMGGRGSKAITATPRQLESLIRISQSLAKMRLGGEVRASDVTEAIRLMRVATQTAATDPRTGTIDMDLITTGRMAVDPAQVGFLAEAMRSLLSTKKGARMNIIQVRNLMQRDSTLPVNMPELEAAVKELQESDECPFKYIEDTKTLIVNE